MHLYFLRHGEASWPDWTKPDDERPLTPEGKTQMRRLARFFHKLDLGLDRVLTSPLPRAQQTAEIVADGLKIKWREVDELVPGFNETGLRQLVQRYPGERLMVVGHEPDFTQTISSLTGATLKLSKAGLALVDLDSDLRRGRLLWLFPPRIAKASR